MQPIPPIRFVPKFPSAVTPPTTDRKLLLSILGDIDSSVDLPPDNAVYALLMYSDDTPEHDLTDIYLERAARAASACPESLQNFKDCLQNFKSRDLALLERILGTPEWESLGQNEECRHSLLRFNSDTLALLAEHSAKISRYMRTSGRWFLNAVLEDLQNRDLTIELMTEEPVSLVKKSAELPPHLRARAAEIGKATRLLRDLYELIARYGAADLSAAGQRLTFNEDGENTNLDAAETMFYVLAQPGYESRLKEQIFNNLKDCNPDERDVYIQALRDILRQITSQGRAVIDLQDTVMDTVPFSELFQGSPTRFDARRAVFFDCIFSYLDLSGSDFREAHFNFCLFGKTDLRCADFTKSKFTDTTFTEVLADGMRTDDPDLAKIAKTQMTKHGRSQTTTTVITDQSFSTKQTTKSKKTAPSPAKKDDCTVS